MGTTPVPAPRLRPVDHVTAAVSSFALVALVLVALAMIVVPLAIRATPFTILTGSMQPALPPGTLVVTRPVPVDSIEIGDVITYQLHSGEPEVVTHRVVGVGFTGEGERLFVTRGDANTADDDPVRAVQVRGEVAYHVPYLGYVNTWVGVNRPGWLLKGVAGALILYGLVLVGAGVRDRVRRRGVDAPATSARAVPATAGPVVADGPAQASVATTVAAPPRPVSASAAAGAGRLAPDLSPRRAAAPGVLVAVVVLTGIALGGALVMRRTR